MDGLAPVSKVGQVASDQFEITYDPGKLSPKDIGATVEKLGFGHSLKSPVAASVRTKHLMVQSMTTATSYRAGGKGTLKVGVFLGKNKTLGSTTITITGPEGLEAEVKFLPSVDKAKKVVEVPFGFTKDAKKGSHDLKVTVRYTTQKGGKDKEAFVVTYTLPVTLE